MAQDIARTNSKYSTQEILRRSLDITACTALRLTVKRQTAWHVAMAEEKNFVAPDIRQPVPGKGADGRKGFDGRYAQEVAAAYNDPAKKEYYQKRADEINAVSLVGSVAPLRQTQKDNLKRLTKYLTKLSENDMHLVLMAVPSQAKPVLFTTSGFAASYYKFLARDGRGQDQFITMCQGGQLLQDAAVLPSVPTDSLQRNTLRSEIITLLRELISKTSYYYNAAGIMC